MAVTTIKVKETGKLGLESVLTRINMSVRCRRYSVVTKEGVAKRIYEDKRMSEFIGARNTLALPTGNRPDTPSQGQTTITAN